MSESVIAEIQKMTLSLKSALDAWKHLFHLVSVDEKNEKEITEYMRSIPDLDKLKEIVNLKFDQKSGSETMLMWAVWRLKKQTVIDLIEYGADPLYINEADDGLSTWWNIGDDADTEAFAQKVYDVAKILKDYGVRLNRNSAYGWCLYKKVHEAHMPILNAKLETLYFGDAVKM